MLKRLFQVKREYEEAKVEAVEKTVNVLESNVNPFYFILLFGLVLYNWINAVFIIAGLDILFVMYGFYPLIIFFVISYFFIFQCSKFIFPPTQEELEDDTSTFAIFSACSRKEMRCFASIGLSILHTLAFVFYLVNKDLNLI